MAAHSARILTTAIETALSNAGLLVAVGSKPAGGGWQGTEGNSTFAAYTVVYPTPGGASMGSLSVPFDDVHSDYTISSFGSTVAQAQWGDDKVRATLTAASALSVSGRSVQLVAPDVDGGVIRDDDVTPPIFHAPTRWRVMTTAAA